MSIWRRFGFAWVTAGFLVITFIGHWVFGWFAYVNQQEELNVPIEVTDYVVEMLGDTFENWQSEFLQLLWQVVGLTILLYVGSPQSKDSEDRSEEKLDAILRKVDPEGADRILEEIDCRHPQK